MGLSEGGRKGPTNVRAGGGRRVWVVGREGGKGQMLIPGGGGGGRGIFDAGRELTRG